MDRVDSTRIGAYGMTIFSFIHSPHNCVSEGISIHGVQNLRNALATLYAKHTGTAFPICL